MSTLFLGGTGEELAGFLAPILSPAQSEMALVKRARLDFHHKIAHTLVRKFDTLYVKNLNISGMLRNPHLALAIADASWGQFFVVF